MKKTIVTRSKPENLLAEDIKIFEHEFTKVIPNPKIGKYNNVYIFQSKLHKFKHFEFLSKHWKMNEYKKITKFKIFIKNLINFIKSKDKQKPVRIDKAIYFTDEKARMYFHWLLDSVQRLELISNSKLKVNEYELLIDQNLLKYNFIVKLLKIYKFKYTILKDNRVYKIKKLLIPYHLAGSGNYNLQVLNQSRERLRDYFFIKNEKENENKKKIWISRQNSRIRKIKNFEEVENVLKKNGFEVIETENLDFFDQAKIFVNADVIGSIHGGGLSNMLFMDKSKKVIEVRGKNDYHNNCYFSLASGLDLKYYYFLSDVENDDFYHNDYFININEFEEFLKNFL